MRTPGPLNFPPRPIPIPFALSLEGRPQFPNSNRIISFADPHPLNPFLPYRYKNHEGVTSFRSNTFLSAPPSTPGRSTPTCKCAVCIPDGVTGPCNLSTRTILLSPLRIPRRMRILSEHRESKGSSPSSSRFSLDLVFSLSLLSATLTRMPISVHSKGFTGMLNPLDATLTKNPGGATTKRGGVSVQNFNCEL
jgi:hypothetical protein